MIREASRLLFSNSELGFDQDERSLKDLFSPPPSVVGLTTREVLAFWEFVIRGALNSHCVKMWHWSQIEIIHVLKV